MPPSQFIVGSGKKGEEDGADLDDDTQVCSCHVGLCFVDIRTWRLTGILLQNVTKGAIVECVKSGMVDMNDVKSKTKAGTGCGGCMPLVTNIFKVCGLCPLLVCDMMV